MVFLRNFQPYRAGLIKRGENPRDTVVHGWKWPEALRFLNGNSTARGGLSSCGLLARETPEVPQAVKAVAAVVGCTPELDGITFC